MTDIQCPRCQAWNRSTAKYCTECGAALPTASAAPASAASASATPAAGRPSSSGESSPATAAESIAPTGGTASPPHLGPTNGHDEVDTGSPNTERQDADPLTDEEDEYSTGLVLLGRYRLSKELGRGGFGAVYAAWDVNLNRRCAVKENLDTSPEAQRQFAREASVLANLSHPNLPRVTDHFSIPGQGQYLVMDFVEGEDLASLMQRQRLLPVEQVLAWGLQVAGALVYLHSRKQPVVHRDIKPANIRITPEGQAMLVDFGLVKTLDAQFKTTMGARAVTPGYAPPEQYGHGRTDGRTDIYALGATLYKLLTGKEPLESVMRVSGERMPTVQQINPRLPAALGQVVEKAMALDPASRYQSAEELKAALDEAAHSLGPLVSRLRSGAPVSAAAAAPLAGASARPASGPRPPTQARPDASAAPRFPWVWIIGGGLALLLVICMVAGGGLWALLGLSGATPTPQAMAASPTAGPAVSVSPGSGVIPVTPTSDAPAEPTRTPTLTPPPPTATPDPAFLSADRLSYLHLDVGGPDTLDPALSYETGGLQVIQNLYDTLIFYRREDPNVFVPQLAVEVPSVENGGVSADGLTYTFKIRQGVQFHDGSAMSPEDVAYTFQRNILQGGSISPMWLLTEPLLGIGVYDVAALVDPNLVDQSADLAKADPAKLQQVCRRVQDAIQADTEAWTVTFRLSQPWAPFLSTLANGWGGIRSKAWTVANGGWDGDCATWQKHYAPLIGDHNKTKLGSGAMGTGPYKLEAWQADKQIVLAANENYWRKQPAWEGGPSGAPAIKTITIRYSDTFDERLKLLEARQADSAAFSSNAEWTQFDRMTGSICEFTDANCTPSSNPTAPLESLRGFPTSSRNWDIMMNWNMNTQDGNKLIGSGKLDGAGVPPDFFANVHVRRAFQYCFNYDTYLTDILLGEGVRSINVMLPGMIGYNANSPYYAYSPKACEEEFRQAEFDGKNVWETGFTLQLPYLEDSLPRQRIAEIFKTELEAVNPKFKVQALTLPNDDYWADYYEYRLPIFLASWVEDIHDPHNWAAPYSVTNFSTYARMDKDVAAQFQSIINRGVEATDPEQRAKIYQEFNQVYYEQAPAILLFQTMGRHYQQRWVRGWYNNPVFPGMYFYPLSKD
jgi:peptide/nickel transport system substrate-binding protein